MNFQEDGAFRAQGLTSWPRITQLFSKDLHKHGKGNNNIDWPNHPHLEWEHKLTQPTHGQSELFWQTHEAFTYDGTTYPTIWIGGGVGFRHMCLHVPSSMYHSLHSVG